MLRLLLPVAMTILAGQALAQAPTDPSQVPITQVYEQLVIGAAAAKACPQGLVPPLTDAENAQVATNIRTVAAEIVRQAMVRQPGQSWMAVQAKFDGIATGLEKQSTEQMQRVPCDSKAMAELLALHRFHGGWDAASAKLQPAPAAGG